MIRIIRALVRVGAFVLPKPEGRRRAIRVQGFSFVGVIVALFIATVAIIGIFALTSRALISSRVSANQLIAAELAQEGIEIIRGIRQSYINWQDWDWYSTTTPLAHPVGSSQTYCPQYDTMDLNTVTCDPSNPPQLKLDTAGVFYQYNLGVDSGFYRTVTLKRLSYDEVEVVSEVKWKDQAGNWHKLKVYDRLWRWR